MKTNELTKGNIAPQSDIVQDYKYKNNNWRKYDIVVCAVEKRKSQSQRTKLNGRHLNIYFVVIILELYLIFSLLLLFFMKNG